MKKMKDKRYNEEFEKVSNLLWPSEEEDKVTRNFYRDLSLSTKNIEKNKVYKKFNILQQILFIIFGRGSSSKAKN